MVTGSGLLGSALVAVAAENRVNPEAPSMTGATAKVAVTTAAAVGTANRNRIYSVLNFISLTRISYISWLATSHTAETSCFGLSRCVS
jgi:hypothetical protein